MDNSEDRVGNNGSKADGGFLFREQLGQDHSPDNPVVLFLETIDDNSPCSIYVTNYDVEGET